MAATGILGGTFDPVHNAHLAMARAALDHLGLDNLLFIPTGRTRYRLPSATAGRDRAAMLRLAPALLDAGRTVAPADAWPLYVRDKVAQTTEERAAIKAAATHSP